MKFGDVIIATASATVIYAVVDAVLALVLISANSYWGLEAASLVSILLAAVVVGYVWAAKIREESRMRSIGKIAVLSAVLMMFAGMIVYSAIGHYNTLVDEDLRNMFSTGSWTTTDWYAYETMVMATDIALDGVFVLVLGFIGLYVGSMRKPPAKSKE